VGPRDSFIGTQRRLARLPGYLRFGRAQFDIATQGEQTRRTRIAALEPAELNKLEKDASQRKPRVETSRQPPK